MVSHMEDSFKSDAFGVEKEKGKVAVDFEGSPHLEISQLLFLFVVDRAICW